MTPSHGFIASSAPAERVAFFTNKKAICLPSGDQAGCSMFPLTCVSCLISPVALDQRKTCSWSDLASLPVQVEIKANVWLSGDQAGDLLKQSPAPCGVTSLASPKCASSATWISESSRPRNVHARVEPLGEIATAPGALTRAVACVRPETVGRRRQAA